MYDSVLHSKALINVNTHLNFIIFSLPGRSLIKLVNMEVQI